MTNSSVPLTTQRLSADDTGIETASAILKGGGLVAFPTETVYGLGADATNDAAVARIFAAKERPTFNPLIVHVCNLAMAQQLGRIEGRMLDLAKAFWPGPLSLVVPRTSGCKASLLVSAGLDTIALRVPAHPVAQRLLASSGLAIAAPSANLSGHISPTSADHVEAELRGRIEAIVDGGTCSVGLESTIVGLQDDTPLILRPGGIDRAMIDAIAGPLGKDSINPARPAAPGQLESHYAPNTSLRLNADSVSASDVLLAFGRHEIAGAKRTLNLSPSGDLVEAAANLFSFMRELDEDNAASIAVMPIPKQGLGEAINDRLTRAAAPKPEAGR